MHCVMFKTWILTNKKPVTNTLDFFRVFIAASEAWCAAKLEPITQSSTTPVILVAIEKDEVRAHAGEATDKNNRCGLQSFEWTPSSTLGCDLLEVEHLPTTSRHYPIFLTLARGLQGAHEVDQIPRLLRVELVCIGDHRCSVHACHKDEI